VAEHCTVDDCWIVVGDKAYEVPEQWRLHHPGGHLPLKTMAGKDATDAFIQYHPNEVYKMLPRFHVANVVSKDVKESVFVKEHRAIRQKLLEEGKFKTDYSFYLWLSFRLTIMFSISLYLTLSCNGYWAHFAGAVGLGCFWQQLAFIGHDLGHNGITHI